MTLSASRTPHPTVLLYLHLYSLPWEHVYEEFQAIWGKRETVRKVTSQTCIFFFILRKVDYKGKNVKLYAMNELEGVEVQLHHSYTLQQRKVSCQLHIPTTLQPIIHWTGGWLAPRVGLKAAQG
jgi:hypothetical protein